MNEFHALSRIPSAPSSKSWRSIFIAFVIAAIAGASLLGLRWAARGDADPLNVRWPLYLQIGSLGLTVVVGSLTHRPLAAGFGLYFGLVIYMLVEGRAEYPVASLIALTVNGLLPALTGALGLVVIRRMATALRKQKKQ